VLVHHYVVYPRSQSAGQTVAEFDPTSKAATEIEQLYNYTLKRLGMIPNSDARRRSA
jgi:cellulose biosynthesis protein BcsQ